MHSPHSPHPFRLVPRDGSMCSDSGECRSGNAAVDRSSAKQLTPQSVTVHTSSSARCVSPFTPPIQNLYARSCPQSLSSSQHSELLLLLQLTTPSPAPQNALQPLRLPSAAPVSPSSRSRNSLPSSRQRPNSSSHHSSNSLVARLAPVSLGLGR